MDEQRFTDREEQKRTLRHSMLTGSSDESEKESGEPSSGEEEQGPGYEKNLRRHRRRRILVIILILAVIFAGIGAAIYQYATRTIEHSTTLWEQNVEEGSFEGALPFENGVVKYGRDSASLIREDGTVVWTESYEMNQPMAACSDGYLLLADQGSTRMMICTGDGKCGDITTSSPITKAEIASNGMAVAIIEDSSSNYLVFYDKTGRKLDIEIKTKLQGDGYPLDFAISPSGEQLMVSYVYIDEGTIHNKVVFYNFDVGADMIDRIVGGFEQYDDVLVPKVVFLDESHAVAVGEHIVSFYSLKNQQKPSLTTEVEIPENIEEVFYHENGVGLVTSREGEADPYRFLVMDADGETLSEGKLSEIPSGITFSGNDILLYNRDRFQILDSNGKVRYEESSDEEILLMLPLSRNDTFVIFGSGSAWAITFR